MLTSKERAFLRSIAVKLDCTFKMAEEFSENAAKSFSDYLNAHEIIKIALLENENMDKTEMGNMIAREIGAEFVERRGSTVVLYRRSKKKGIKHLL